jgi:hypothetical protein
LLYLNPDGTVNFHQKISDTEGNFTGVLDEQDAFGSSITLLGDIDGNCIPEIFTGAHLDDAETGWNNNQGAGWVIWLGDANTVVKRGNVPQSNLHSALAETIDMATTQSPQSGDFKLDGNLAINIYPNPTNGILNLEILEASENTPVKIEIIDLLGRTIFNSEIDVSSRDLLTLNLGKVPAGNYMVRFTSNEDVVGRVIQVVR